MYGRTCTVFPATTLVFSLVFTDVANVYRWDLQQHCFGTVLSSTTFHADTCNIDDDVITAHIFQLTAGQATIQTATSATPAPSGAQTKLAAMFVTPPGKQRCPLPPPQLLRLRVLMRLDFGLHKTAAPARMPNICQSEKWICCLWCLFPIWPVRERCLN